MLTSHCFLFTWHQGVWFYPNEWLNEVFGTVFLLQKRKQRGLSWVTCRRHFPYLCSLPHAPQTAGSLVKSNREILGGRKKICYNYLASDPHLLCTHYHSPSSYKKFGVSSMGWIWPILFIPTEVPTEFYRASNIAEALKVKQTGDPLLKKKKPWSFIGT